MPTAELPVTLTVICSRYPDVPKGALFYMTRRHCKPQPLNVGGSGNRRQCGYLAADVAKAVKKWQKERLPSDCLEFKERGVTWVAEEKLPDGINRETADRMHRDGQIRKPDERPLAGPTPWHRKFWPLEDVNGVLAKYAVPVVKRDTPRTLAALDLLPPGTMVSRPEAVLLGFTPGYLRDHSDLRDDRGAADKRRAADPTPAPPIGRLIGARWVERITARGHRGREPMYNLGDLRDIRRVVDNPPIPEGTVLVRDAVAKLAAVGIRTSRTGLMTLIHSGVIRGDQAECYKRNLSPDSLWYMTWADRGKIPGAVVAAEPVQPVRIVGTDSPLPVELKVPPPTGPTLTAGETSAVFSLDGRPRFTADHVRAKRKRGRPRVDPGDERARYDRLARYTKAIHAGVSRERFCADERTTVKALEALQVWAAKRRARAKQKTHRTPE